MLKINLRKGVLKRNITVERKGELKTYEVGFTYEEFIFNLLCDAGSTGCTIAELRMQSNLSEQTISGILKRFIDLNRVRRQNVSKRKKIPRYKYYVKFRWMNTM